MLLREIDAIVGKDKITTEEMRELDARVQALASEAGWQGIDAIPEEGDEDALDELVQEQGDRPITAAGTSSGGAKPSLSGLLPVTEGSVWGSWSDMASTQPPPRVRAALASAGSGLASGRRDEWAVLTKYDEVMAHGKEKAMKEDAARAKAEMRAFLAAQMQNRDVTASTIKAEEQQWAQTFKVHPVSDGRGCGCGDMLW